MTRMYPGYGWLKYLRDFRRFRDLNEGARGGRLPLHWRDRYPCLKDDTGNTPFDPHYIYHTAWAARKLREIAPDEHCDISSSIYFSTIVSAFVPVRFYDYRPVSLHLTDLASDRADLLQLPFENHSLKSLSCMHVAEHIGLGRYGDPLDPNGDLQAISELSRVLAPGGSLLFVVPVGIPKIAFNAHRIYAPQQIAEAFSQLTIEEFSLLPDRWEHGLIENASFAEANRQQYGCGCFHFTRPSS